MIIPARQAAFTIAVMQTSNRSLTILLILNNAFYRDAHFEQLLFKDIATKLLLDETSAYNLSEIRPSFFISMTFLLIIFPILEIIITSET